MYRSQNHKQCDEFNDERSYTDFSVTLDSGLFQFSPNAMEAHNIFYYYLGHSISSSSCNSLLSSVSLRVYASIPWLSARYPCTVSSFLSRNIRVAISCKLSFQSHEDAIERILPHWSALTVHSFKWCFPVAWLQLQKHLIKHNMVERNKACCNYIK